MSAHFKNHQDKQENTMLNHEQAFECLDSTKTNHNLAKNKAAVLTLALKRRDFKLHSGACNFARA